MIAGELKSKIDQVWDAFWSGGISNPLEVIEQITYLLFVRRLDDLQTLAEKKARVTGGSIDREIYGPGQEQLRWSRFKNNEPETMWRIVGEGVFPFLRALGGDGSTYGDHMRDARFTIPTPALLSRVVDMLDDIPMAERDTNGDLYEYLLSKIASAGVNGQFRTPRHIIELMVAMMAPKPEDEICDPAAGTAGFLVAASEYVRREHPGVLTNAAQRSHFHTSMFHGFDFDSTMYVTEVLETWQTATPKVSATAPSDWGSFFESMASDRKPSAFGALIQGKDTRGTFRAARQLHDGGATDIYGAIFLTLSRMGVVDHVSKFDLAHRMTQLISDAPTASTISGTLRNLADVAEKHRGHGDPALTYQDPELQILDPFFAFYLAHGDWTLPLPARTD